MGVAEAAKRRPIFELLELGLPVAGGLQFDLRTVLGHLRHEIGHYYQPILAPAGSPAIERCRELMGDEREDYQAALERHYEIGPLHDWADRYATMHPWEDWAETFAHYRHIRDVLQTAEAYGVSVSGPAVLAADAAPLYSYPAAAPIEQLTFIDELVRAA
jgi:hypothetical protein